MARIAIDRGRNIEKMPPFDAIIDTIMCNYVQKLTGQAFEFLLAIHHIVGFPPTILWNT